MTDEQFAKLTDALLRLRTPIPVDVDLWSSDEIAAYLKVSAFQVMNRYAPLPDFPKAIRLPTGTGSKGFPRWKAKDVIAWAEKHQEKERRRAA